MSSQERLAIQSCYLAPVWLLLLVGAICSVLTEQFPFSSKHGGLGFATLFFIFASTIFPALQFFFHDAQFEQQRIGSAGAFKFGFLASAVILVLYIAAQNVPIPSLTATAFVIGSFALVFIAPLTLTKRVDSSNTRANKAG